MGQVQRVKFEVIPFGPSVQMIKSLLVEHCVLPLASFPIRKRLSKEMTARSLLLYGPRGTGKSMLARAIASEAGAAFFDLSPTVLNALAGLTADKKDLIGWKQPVSEVSPYVHPKYGADVLIFKVLAVARAEAPSVIYMDNVDEIFWAAAKKKKAVDMSHPNRIKKILIQAIKQIKTGEDSLPEDRVLWIGCTSQPYGEGVNQKELIENFDFKVWVSFPDTGSRSLLFRKFIEEKGIVVDANKFDLSALAIASDGYSAGALKMCVERVLTQRRRDMLHMRKLEVQEFLGPLARTPFSWPEDWTKMRNFDHDASNEKKVDLTKG